MASEARDAQTQNTRVHFDRISRRWSRNYDSQSGAMRQRIADFIVALAALPQGARVLDFGCGSGDITRMLATEGYVMTGIDLSPAMIAMALQQPGAGGIDWAVAQGNVAILPFIDSSFDGALASSVLEYHPNPAAQLSEVARVLKPGGILAFTVPNMDHPLRAKEELWRDLARGWLWPLLRLTRRHDYFEYLRVSVNRWPLEKWLAISRAAGFETQTPANLNEPLVMIVCRKPA